MRFFRISKVLVDYFLLNNLNQHRNKFLGLRIKEACEKLGPTFVKFGQLLSLRYDILPERDAKELQKLLDSVEPFSYQLTRKIIKKDLGKYPEEIFEYLDKKPIASASVSQVYRARLKTGEEVAVKVRRPFIGKKIEEDIQIIRRFGKILQFFSSTLKRIRISEVVEELNAILQKEIDFQNELTNIADMQNFLGKYGLKRIRKDLGHIFIPKSYKQLSSKNILTMDFIDGLSMKEILSAPEKPGYDAKKSLKTLICGCLRGMFEDGEYFFHGDPHPANIIVMKNGDVGFVDFGIVGKFTENQNKRASDLFLAVYTQNIDGTIDASMKLAGTHSKKFEPLLREDMRKYLEKTKSSGIGFWFFDIAKIFVKHNIRFPLYLTLFGRANMIFDGLIHSVDPESTALEYLGKELRRGVIKRTFHNITHTNYLAVAYHLSRKLKESPEKINNLINRTYNYFLR